MTIETLIAGLAALLVVALIIIAMTSTRQPAKKEAHARCLLKDPDRHDAP
jgi:hypothetical protein